MSRSGYSDDMDDQWLFIRWRGAVASAIRGKRGQAFLKEMLAALDKIESKTLIADELKTECGVCALGAVGEQRGMDMTGLDPYDHDTIAEKFEIPRALACEIMFHNDEITTTPERRYSFVRQWVEEQIK